MTTGEKNTKLDTQRTLGELAVPPFNLSREWKELVKGGFPKVVTVTSSPLADKEIIS